MKNSQDTIPDFFIVGAPKCGTTSLCQYLNEHPEFFISKPKEPNYFGRDLITKPRKARISHQEYLALFKEGKDKICGEGSTWYLYSDTAAQEIYELNPQAKIIIILRNPVDFLYSYHSQSLLELTEDIQDFEEALEAEDDRRNGKRIPPDCIRTSALFYSEVASFTKHIQKYLKVFDRDCIHIILFDDFKKDTLGVYQEVLSFLGVNSEFQPEFKIYNSNSRMRNRVLYNIYMKIKWWFFTIGKMFKSVPFYSLIKNIILGILNHKYLKKFLFQKIDRPPMNLELRKHLIRKFTPEVEQLSSLLGRDLSHWSQEE